jgi:L-seryl-tRNA(Ser) seleniumtransferase
MILGKKSFLDLIKVNPLARALRIDKLTLAALESTLLFYLDEERAMEEIPTLRMLGADLGKLRRRGRRLLKKVPEAVKDKAVFTLREDVSQVGGGALPLQDLPTIVLAVNPSHLSVNEMEENLRKGDPPIVSRISKDELVLDMRTVSDAEILLLAKGIEKALAEGTGHIKT